MPPKAYENVSLEGKSILITGGGSGMGREAALLAAGRGAQVAVVDINETSGQETVEALGAQGGAGYFVKADITDESEVRDMVASVVQRSGGLDGAFNNAGIIGPAGKIADFSYEQWQQVLDINLNGPFLCTKYEIEHMQGNGGGSIVNTASTAGAVAYPNLPAYVASKHGVVGLTRQAAIDYAPLGIRVNGVLPGSTVTPLAAAALEDPEIKAKAEAAQPIGRLGRPEEIAEMAAWLLSDASSFVIGSTFFVDGGVNAA